MTEAGDVVNRAKIAAKALEDVLTNEQVTGATVKETAVALDDIEADLERLINNG